MYRKVTHKFPNMCDGDYLLMLVRVTKGNSFFGRKQALHISSVVQHYKHIH